MFVRKDKKRISSELLCFCLFLVMVFGSTMLFAQDELELTPEKKTLVIDKISNTLNKRYVHGDVALKMEKAVKENLSQGKYDDVADMGTFTMRLTRDLVGVSKDKHLRITPLDYSAREDNPEAAEARAKARREMSRRGNYGFQKVEILPRQCWLSEAGCIRKRPGGWSDCYSCLEFPGQC